VLSKNERAYLQEALHVKSGYRWKLDHGIRRKLFQALADLALIFEKMPAKRLHLTWRKYHEVVVPTLTTIVLAAREEGFYEEIPWQSLANALMVARKRFDWKRLYEDKDYRYRLTSWLKRYQDRTGKRYYWAPTVEERKSLYEKWFSNEQNSEALKKLRQPDPRVEFLKDENGDEWMVSLTKLSPPTRNPKP
jgi:hypothetical protein